MPCPDTSEQPPAVCFLLPGIDFTDSEQIKNLKGQMPGFAQCPKQVLGGFVWTGNVPGADQPQVLAEWFKTLVRENLQPVPYLLERQEDYADLVWAPVATALWFGYATLPKEPAMLKKAMWALGGMIARLLMMDDKSMALRCLIMYFDAAVRQLWPNMEKYVKEHLHDLYGQHFENPYQVLAALTQLVHVPPVEDLLYPVLGMFIHWAVRTTAAETSRKLLGYACVNGVPWSQFDDMPVDIGDISACLCLRGAELAKAIDATVICKFSNMAITIADVHEAINHDDIVERFGLAMSNLEKLQRGFGPEWHAEPVEVDSQTVAKITLEACFRAPNHRSGADPLIELMESECMPIPPKCQTRITERRADARRMCLKAAAAEEPPNNLYHMWSVGVRLWTVDEHKKVLEILINMEEWQLVECVMLHVPDPDRTQLVQSLATESQRLDLDLCLANTLAKETKMSTNVAQLGSPNFSYSVCKAIDKANLWNRGTQCPDRTVVFTEKDLRGHPGLVKLALRGFYFCVFFFWIQDVFFFDSGRV